MTDPNALAAFSPGVPQAVQPAGPTPVRQIAPNVYLTDFTDETVKQYEFELYSGKTGVADRICILRPDAIAKGRSHYHDKLKSGILCTSEYTRQGTQETLSREGFCCKWLGTSQVRFAALVLQYGTDTKGNPVQPFSYSLKLWRFGADKYIQLRAINRDFPLGQHDLGILCTDDKYQKMQIGAKPDCFLLHPKFPADVKAQIDGWASASVPKLARELGRTVPDAELHKELTQLGILTAPGAGPAMVASTDAPVANFDDIITTAVPGK
jgi:hypothetical protein